MLACLLIYLTVGVMTVVHSRLTPKKPIDLLVLAYCALIGPPVLLAAGFVRLARLVVD